MPEKQLLLLIRFGFDVAGAVLFLEPFYAAGGVDIFLFAGVEWMAHRAYLCMDFLCRAAGLKGIATAAMYHNLIVFWMYSFLHGHRFSERQLKTKL